MITKVNYKFRTLAPIHTGEDAKGILKQFRRMRKLIHCDSHERSRFLPHEKVLKRQAIATLLQLLWEKMPDKGRYNIYGEVQDKLFAAAHEATKEEFIQSLATKLDVRDISASKEKEIGIIDLLELFDDYELLSLCRKESIYIGSMFRYMKDNEISAIGELKEVLKREFTAKKMDSYIDNVPTIMGNSLRGLIRRIVMEDYFTQTGIVELLDELWDMLNTGGAITDSNGFEDLKRRRELTEICPMLGLLGSAIGNQTMQGEMSVGIANLCCKENGTGAHSYHELLEIIFGTRLDTKKFDNEIGVIIQDDSSNAATQMRYLFEAIIEGSEFTHTFKCDSKQPLVISAFWKALQLFCENGCILAKESIGLGFLDLSELASQIPQNATDLYDNHLKENSERIRAYWQSEQENILEGKKKKKKATKDK